MWALTGLGVGTAAWLCLHPMRTQSSGDAQLLYLLMTLVVVCLVVRPATPFVSGRFMAQLGKISYGVYLLHMFIISFAKKLPGGTTPAWCFLFSSIASVAAASLVYKYFESPIIAFYKRNLSPLQPARSIRPALSKAPAPMPNAIEAKVQSLADSTNPAT